MALKGYASPVRRGEHRNLSLSPNDLMHRNKIIDNAIANGKRIYFEIGIETKKRSPGMLRLYWKLITELYFHNFGEYPSEAQKNAFHEDFKEEFGLRRPSLINPTKLVPIGMSEADNHDGAHLIDCAFLELSKSDMDSHHQSEAREAWFDYWRNGGPKYRDEADFRSKATLCAACGIGGNIQLAHMTSRGADKSRENYPANWIPLCFRHHIEVQHQKGVESFLKQFPHLRKRWEESKCKQ